MQLRTIGSLVAVVGMTLVACGGGDAESLCEQQEECAKKAGTGFSVTECKESLVKDREEANTEGCGDEYGEAESCIAGLEFSCADFSGDGFNKKSLAECGSKIEKYNKCK